MRWRTSVGVVCQCALLAGFSSLAYPQALSGHHRPIPGGVVSMVVGSTDSPRPAVKFGNRPVFVARLRQQWVALLGLSLTTVPGRYVVSIAYDEDESEIRDFVVKPHRYPVRRYVEQIRRRDAAETEDLPKLSDMRTRLLELASLWSDVPLTDLPLRTPVDAAASSEYGIRWVKGDRMTEPVDHAEFHVPPGMLVRAPGGGTVRELLRMNDAGLAICLDHGMGMLSIIGPVQDTKVGSGDRVAPEAVLGVAPSTGSGPAKIGWYLALNRVWVNPLFLARAP